MESLTTLLNKTNWSGSNILITNFDNIKEDEFKKWTKEFAAKAETQGVCCIYISEIDKASDKSIIFKQLEYGLHINSLRSGSQRLFFLYNITSQAEALMYVAGFNITKLICNDFNLFWTVSLLYRYKHETFGPDTYLLNCIDGNPQLFYGRRVIMAIMRYCIEQRITYVDFGAELGPVDYSSKLGCRGRFFGNKGLRNEASIRGYGTHRIALDWLKLLFKNMRLDKEDIYIVHVGEGSMNELGIPSSGFVRSSKFKMSLIDPPWGGYDYWYASGELDISGPVDGVLRIIPKEVDYIPAKTSRTKDPVIIGNRVLDYGGGDGVLGRNLVIGEYVKYDLGDELPTGVFSDIILRHVCHHIKDLRNLFYNIHSYMGKDCNVWIKDHDCESSRLAYWLSSYHGVTRKNVFSKEFKVVTWNKYYEGFFSFRDFIEFLEEIGFKVEVVIKPEGTFRSGWLKCKLVNNMIVLPNTKLFSITKRMAILKLPYQYSGVVPDGVIRMGMFGYDFYFFNMLSVLKLIIDSSISEVFVKEKGIWKDMGRGNFIEPRDKLYELVKNVDLMKVIPYYDELIVSLWAMSNSKFNPKPRIVIEHLCHIKKSIGTNFVITYPRMNRAKEMGLEVTNGIMKQRFMVNGKWVEFEDWCAEPIQFLDLEVSCMSMRRFLCFIERDELGKMKWERFNDERFDPNHPLMNLWFVVVPRGIFDTRFQSIKNTQQVGVRRSGIKVREISHTDVFYMYNLRKQVMKALFPECIVYYGEVDGYIKYKKKEAKITVSGHLLNLLLMNGSEVVDWRIYFDCIDNNLKIQFDKKFKAEYKIIFNKGLITETYEDMMLAVWHNYFDYYIAIGTYIIYCGMFNLKVNKVLIIYCLYRLNRTRRLYPIFNYLFPTGLVRHLKKVKLPSEPIK